MRKIKQKIPMENPRGCFALQFIELLFDEFLNLGALTNSVAEVVQLRTANLTVTDNFNLSYVGRVEREGLFYAYAVCYAANGEGGTNAAVVSCDYGAFKKLNSFASAFLDLVVNADGVTYVELMGAFAELLICKNFELVHDVVSPISQEFLNFRTFVRSFAEDRSLCMDGVFSPAQAEVIIPHPSPFGKSFPTIFSILF